MMLSMRAHLKQMKCADIPPNNLADKMTKMRCEMKYPDRLSDIPPKHNLSDEGTKITPHSIFSKHIFAEKVASFPA